MYLILSSCQISKNAFSKVLPILNAAHNIPLSETEIAFGLEIIDSSKQKSEQLRNYIFSIIKLIIFKDRANIFQTNEQKINVVFNKVRKFIISDLKNNFNLAKQNNCVPKFVKNFLVKNVLAEYNVHSGELRFNI